MKELRHRGTIASRSAVSILGLTVLAAAITQFVLFAVFLDRTMILRPFSDMITYIDDYLHFRQHDDVLGYLWAPHTQHHQPIIRVLTALDVNAFRASGVPFVVAATIATIVAALLIYVEFRRDQQLTGPMRTLDWLGPMLLLTTTTAVDCSIPINSIYPLSLVFLVATLVLFESGAEGARYTGVKRTAALVTAVLASFSNAGGLVIWPAILWLAWRGGASKRWLIGIGALGFGYGLFYVLTLSSTDIGGPSRVFNFEHLLKMADYLLAYLGLPLSRAPGLGFMARALGAVLLAAAIIAILCDAILLRLATRLHRVGVGLIIVALGTAFLVTLGRVDIEQEVKLPVRYAIFVAPLHIGLLALVLPFLARLATTPRRQIILLGAGTALAGILLLLQIFSGRSAMIVSSSIANTIARFEETGVVDPGWERLFPNVGQADRVLMELRNLDK
jgi:hypothetical protein